MQKALKTKHVLAYAALADLIDHPDYPDHSIETIGQLEKIEIEKKYDLMLKAAMMGDEDNAWYKMAVIFDVDSCWKAICLKLFENYKLKAQVSRQSSTVDAEALSIVAFMEFLLNVKSREKPFIKR